MIIMFFWLPSKFLHNQHGTGKLRDDSLDGRSRKKGHGSHCGRLGMGNIRFQFCSGEPLRRWFGTKWILAPPKHGKSRSKLTSLEITNQTPFLIRREIFSCLFVCFLFLFVFLFFCFILFFAGFFVIGPTDLFSYNL